MNTQSLIKDATNHRNGRQRGKEARLARLATANVPTDRDGMAAWLADALDAQLEAARGVYHCCTVRIANGVDPDLPTQGNTGCRITRVPIKAYLVEAGDADDDPVEGFWNVCWGNAGPGFLEPVAILLDRAETAEQAEAIVRTALLSKRDCFATRANAHAAVEKMLASLPRTAPTN